MTLQNIMDSTEKQLEDMLNELKSRSIVAVILESSFLIFLLSFLMVSNSITLLVMLLNHRIRTIPNMFVASLAFTDLCLGGFVSVPLGLLY